MEAIPQGLVAIARLLARAAAEEALIRQSQTPATGRRAPGPAIVKEQEHGEARKE